MEQFQVSPYNIGDSLFPFCFESFLIFKQIKEKKFLSSEDILCVHRIFETGQSTGKEQRTLNTGVKVQVPKRQLGQYWELIVPNIAKIQKA